MSHSGIGLGDTHIELETRLGESDGRSLDGTEVRPDDTRPTADTDPPGPTTDADPQPRTDADPQPRTDTNPPAPGTDTDRDHWSTIRSTVALVDRTDKLKNDNNYATKKTLGSGLLDIGLLMANAAQLKSLVDLGPDGQKFFYPNIVLIALSISLQVAAGIVMLILGSMEIETERSKKRAARLNDTCLGLILFVTVVNLFISSFGMDMSNDIKTFLNTTKQ